MPYPPDIGIVYQENLSTPDFPVLSKTCSIKGKSEDSFPVELFLSDNTENMSQMVLDFNNRQSHFICKVSGRVSRMKVTGNLIRPESKDIFKMLQRIPVIYKIVIVVQVTKILAHVSLSIL